MRVLTIVLSLILAAPLASLPPSTANAQLLPPHAATGEADFRDWLKSLETEGTKSSFGEIKFDSASQALTVDNLILTSRPASSPPNAVGAQLSIAKLTLNGFVAASDGYRFNAANGEGIALGITGAPSDVTLARLEVGKSFIPNIGKFQADPKRPVTSQIGLLSLLSKASIESLSSSQIAVGESFKATKFSITGVASGSISSITLDGLVYRMGRGSSNAPAADAGLVINNLAVTDVDIGAYISLFDESAYLSAGAAKPWRNFIEAVVVKGLSFKNGPLSIAADNADFGAMKVRQFPQNITAIFDSVARDPGYLQANPAQAETLSNAVRQSFAFEKANLGNVAITAPNNDGNISIFASSATFSNLTATHLDELGFGAVKINDAGGSLAIRSLQFQDIGLLSQAPSAASPAGPIPVALPTIGSVMGEGFDVNAGGMSYSFDKLDLAMSYFVGTTPTNVKAELKHFRFPVAQISNPGLRQTLVDFGYTNVDLSVEASGSWQDSASALAIDNVRITGAEMGTVNLSGSLTGVTRNGIEHPGTALGPEILAGGLQNFRLSFENASIFDRFLVQAAKVNNKTPDELKKILSANMPAILSQIPSPAIRNKFVFAAVSFINSPKIIELVATTSEITPVEQVIAATRAPYSLPVVLKLDASANDRK